MTKLQKQVNEQLRDADDLITMWLVAGCIAIALLPALIMYLLFT